jgi:uncharacterized membrane protein YqiK
MDSSQPGASAGFLWNWSWIIGVLLLLMAYRLVLRLLGVVIIADDSLAIVKKKFVLLGRNKRLPSGSIVALNGEAGLQADTLAPGLHFGYWPWQFVIESRKFTTIPEGNVGVVEARDGKPLAQGRILAAHVECGMFQDARAFLINGGERGPQISVIPPGTYRINTALFEVTEAPATDIPDTSVGLVTTREGSPMPTGEIAGVIVPGHNSFQDGQAFISAGGFKGPQEQVILAGRYYLNPKFVEVVPAPLTDVAIAHVGVVIAYVGAEGRDVTGDSFKHGNLVSRGEKGVWVEPLDPGKYPINPRTHRVELVPTANVVLNWANDKSESHKLDERLSSITVRSSDGFKYVLDVAQIIHIPRTDAPKVIARFGSVANLVTQVLEPTIGNYFRNAAQSSDVIAFLAARKERQQDARDSIADALKEYNVGAVDTLIGDIVPPDSLMKTLTDRKIAEQEQITYGTQKTAEQTRKELQEAKALADTQARVVDAQRGVQIAEFDAQSAVKKAEGEARAKTVNAEADAMVTTTVGQATAERTLAIGTAEADVIKLKTAAMEPDKFALVEVARALGTSGFKLVPDIVAGGGGEQGGSLVQVLLGNMLHDQLVARQTSGTHTPTAIAKK